MSFPIDSTSTTVDSGSSNTFSVDEYAPVDCLPPFVRMNWRAVAASIPMDISCDELLELHPKHVISMKQDASRIICLAL